MVDEVEIGVGEVLGEEGRSVSSGDRVKSEGREWVYR